MSDTDQEGMGMGMGVVEGMGMGMGVAEGMVRSSFPSSMVCKDPQ